MLRKPKALLLFLAFVVCASALVLPAQTAPHRAAPVPLYRDPVHDGAADPTLIWNRADKAWWMFYTNRRADMTPDGPHDVRWVHGTAIGIAVSHDGGTTWKYKGTASLPYGGKDYTFWAPEIIDYRGTYHMYVTVVPGIFRDWNAPREIVHLTSPDLEHWRYDSRIEVGSDRIIDPCVFRLPNGAWRMWYKDERDHSYIHFADSTDLSKWRAVGTAIHDKSSEAPKVFRWQDSYWMLTDAWNGLGVYRSPDLLHWTAQEHNLLQTPGTQPTDRAQGHHPDVIVHGSRAFLFYFTHQQGADLDPKLSNSAQRTFLQVRELKMDGKELTVRRNEPTYVDLGKGPGTQPEQ